MNKKQTKNKTKQNKKKKKRQKVVSYKFNVLGCVLQLVIKKNSIKKC